MLQAMRSKPIFRWTTASAALVCALLAGGCREDMQNQPKMIPQRESKFFPDGRSVRPQVPGTVARNELEANAYFYSGIENGTAQDKMPYPVTMTVLRRGQEQYNIYCTPCHSRVGNGRGMIVERGYKPAGNLISARIMQEPLGHYFDVISNGYGAMPDYGAQIAVKDRWAIAAYIRALQLSQHATLSDMPAGTNVQTLAEVSQQMGYPANFPDGWTLPALTNVPSAGEMTGPMAGPNGKAMAAPPKTKSGKLPTPKRQGPNHPVME
jgi:mono/diheme cytochrome c family protein